MERQEPWEEAEWDSTGPAPGRTGEMGPGACSICNSFIGMKKTGERKLLRMRDAETELFLNRMLLKPSRRHVLVL